MAGIGLAMIFPQVSLFETRPLQVGNVSFSAVGLFSPWLFTTLRAGMPAIPHDPSGKRKSRLGIDCSVPDGRMLSNASNRALIQFRFSRSAGQ